MLCFLEYHVKSINSIHVPVSIFAYKTTYTMSVLQQGVHQIDSSATAAMKRGPHFKRFGHYVTTHYIIIMCTL